MWSNNILWFHLCIMSDGLFLTKIQLHLVKVAFGKHLVKDRKVVSPRSYFQNTENASHPIYTP